jgi:hypothetical protein
MDDLNTYDVVVKRGGRTSLRPVAAPKAPCRSDWRSPLFCPVDAEPDQKLSGCRSRQFAQERSYVDESKAKSSLHFTVPPPQPSTADAFAAASSGARCGAHEPKGLPTGLRET